MPNNRQLAFLIWLSIVAIWAMSRADVRATLRSLLRTVASPKLLIPLVVLSGWVLGLVVLGSHFGLWSASRVTDTAFWFTTAGLVLFGSMGKVAKDRYFVRRAVRATVEATALVQAASEVFVFGLVTELVIQPILAVLAMMSAVAAQKAEHHRAKALIDASLSAVGLALLLFVGVSLVSNWDSLDKVDLAQQLLLPVWLTIGVLPFIYWLGLFAAYEIAFLRIGWGSKEKRVTRMLQRAALIMGLHIKATEVGSFTGLWQLRLAEADSFKSARRVVADFRRAIAGERRAAREAQVRLDRYAGVEGADDDGLRLDRREFEATTEVLRWLGTCQMGWYRNSGADRYRSDLMSFALDGYVSRRLPKPDGIEMRVSEDGQKWFAWRRTVTGWVFAIGAVGPPPDQWEYDGPNPPIGFPGDDPRWGSGPFGQDVNLNW